MNPGCALCGGCCCRYVVVNHDGDATPDDKRWIGYHGIQTPIGVLLPAPCSKLAAGLCTVYETRPQCCRDFKPGGEACRAVLKVARPDQMHAILALVDKEG